jgi:hypothetical protein
MGEPVIHGGLPARHHLQSVLDGECLRRAQRVKGQRCDLGLDGVVPVEDSGDGLWIRRNTRPHTSNTSSNHRQLQKVIHRRRKLR